jgi:hypothetical protein
MPAPAIKCYPDIVMNANNTQKLSFGVITALKLGTSAVEATHKVKNPSSDADEKVIGILRGFAWENEQASEIRLVGQCRSDIAEAINKLLTNPKEIQDSGVEVSFIVYQYDKAKGYFEARKGTTLKAALSQEGGALNFQLDHESDQRNMNNFDVTLTPKRNVQNEVHVTDFHSQTQVIAWGHE